VRAADTSADDQLNPSRGPSSATTMRYALESDRLMILEYQ
jgi:hypothetical protein